MSEASLEERKTKLTAHEQGTEIPLGWKPTAAEPVPVVRCVQIKKDGYRCKNWSIRGYSKCRKHSGPGALMKNGNVSQYVENMLEAAKLRLVDDSDMALDALRDFISQPGTSEAIKLKAATEILDRAGIKGGMDIKVDLQVSDNPSEQINERLSALLEGAQAVEKMKQEALARASAEEPEIIDGEVVEDGQETLF